MRREYTTVVTTPVKMAAHVYPQGGATTHAHAAQVILESTASSIQVSQRDYNHINTANFHQVHYHSPKITLNSTFHWK